MDSCAPKSRELYYYYSYSTTFHVLFGLLYLGNTERTTKRFMLIQKVGSANILIYCHGLALFMVLLGSLLSYIILKSAFTFYVHYENGLILIPIGLSIGLYSVLSKRR